MAANSNVRCAPATGTGAAQRMLCAHLGSEQSVRPLPSLSKPSLQAKSPASVSNCERVGVTVGVPVGLVVIVALRVGITEAVGVALPVFARVGVEEAWGEAEADGVVGVAVGGEGVTVGEALPLLESPYT